MRPRPLAARFGRRMAPLALLAGLVVGVLLPAVWQRLALAERRGEATAWARQVASRIEGLAHERPLLWPYDVDQLREITEPLVRAPVDAGVRVDVPGAEGVYAVGAPVRPDEVTGWGVVRSGGKAVGRVRVTLDAAGMRGGGQGVWLGAGAAGLLLAAALFFLPVATVKRADTRNADLWDALAEANAGLEARVRARTAELQRLSTRLRAAQEEERARISRDLHDELGQTLTGLRLQLTTIEALTEPGAPARLLAGRALTAVDDGVEQIRRLAHNLRPPALDALGLPAALRSHAERWASSAGLALEAEIVEAEPPPSAAEVLFRVAQEALTNVARHAAASRVKVSFAPADDGWRLVVEDDGRGLAAPAPGGSGGLGLLGARERVEQAEGYLDVEDREAGGVRVLAWVPGGR